MELYRRAGGQKYQCIACCGAISSRGKEYFAYKPRAFNGDDFLGFCRALHERLAGRKYFLQLDNCRIHTTKDVKAWANEVRVPLVMGVPYCPHFAGIENFWGGCKRTFRTIGTKVILGGRERNLAEEAEQSVNV